MDVETLCMQSLMSVERKLVIKGMVCNRCIIMVQSVIVGLGLTIKEINLGEVTIILTSDSADWVKVEQRISDLGFTILEDKKERLIREIKELVRTVYSGDFDFGPDFRFSDLVQKHLLKSYEVISSVFSSSEGMNLEKYIMQYRIEMVKGLLMYSNSSLADISFNLGFSSVAHLSKQFKQHTGLTITHFREIRTKKEVVKDSGSVVSVGIM